MVTSNDELHDHKIELLEKRSFQRWCCSHIRNYNFTDYIKNPMGEREMSLKNGGVFSDEIQGNGGNGDDDDDGDGGCAFSL